MSACIYSYRNLATEHETLMQKYLHLLQIVETEKTVAKQLRQQIEDGEIEIERLKLEVSRLGGCGGASRACGGAGVRRRRARSARLKKALDEG